MEENFQTQILETLNKIFIALIILIALVAMNLIYNVTRPITESPASETTTTTGNEWGFNEVDAIEALEIMNKEEISLIYFGSESCGYCQDFEPILNAAEEELGFTANYLSVDVVANNADLDKLIEAMDKETSYPNGDEIVEGTYGEFYGLTPTVILVKDGEIVDGTIGGMNLDDLINFLEDNGF